MADKEAIFVLDSYLSIATRAWVASSSVQSIPSDMEELFVATMG
jgi:hypothetical protein